MIDIFPRLMLRVVDWSLGRVRLLPGDSSIIAGGFTCVEQDQSGDRAMHDVLK